MGLTPSHTPHPPTPYRPGVWDLYTSMRQEPQWQGQTLVQRSCECRGGRGRGARDCPTVRLNAGMVCALLAEYHRQRFVFMEGPGAAAGAPGSASLAGGDPALASGGSSMLGGGGAAGLAGGGGGAVGATAVVWDEEGLAAAAALATSSAAGDEALGGGGGGRRRPNITLRGMEAHPEAYVQVAARCPLLLGPSRPRRLPVWAVPLAGLPPSSPRSACTAWHTLAAGPKRLNVDRCAACRAWSGCWACTAAGRYATTALHTT